VNARQHRRFSSHSRTGQHAVRDGRRSWPTQPGNSKPAAEGVEAEIPEHDADTETSSADFRRTKGSPSAAQTLRQDLGSRLQEKVARMMTSGRNRGCDSPSADALINGEARCHGG